jgi:hypothetical protein
MKRLDSFSLAGALCVLVATGALPIASRPATAAERALVSGSVWPG